MTDVAQLIREKLSECSGSVSLDFSPATDGLLKCLLKLALIELRA